MKKHVLFFISILIISSIGTLAHPHQENSLDDTLFTEDQSQPYQLYRITPALKQQDISSGLEIVSGNPGESHDILVDEQTTQILTLKGYQLTLIDQNPYVVSAQTADGYPTFEEMEQTLLSLSTRYPHITSLYSIGKSVENRDIWCLEITDNPEIDEDEPGVCYMGLHHAREWPTIEICLHLAETLLNGSDENKTMHELIDANRIFIIPCVNPDGYVYDHDMNQGIRWWRKNRHYFKTYDSYGVDLNRNYAGSCDGDALGMWGSTGMSHTPSSLLYCGPDQFSEPETTALKEFFRNQTIHASISYHTYGELVMWPWGYSLDKTTADDTYLSELGTRIAAQISKQNNQGTYLPTQSAGLYPTTGDTSDWVYGYHHYVLGSPHFTYTIEACNQFHPDSSVLEQVCNENVEGALILLNEAKNISQLTPRVLPPQLYINQIDEEACSLHWKISNPSSQPTKFELQEFNDLHYVINDAEEIQETLILDGFSVTSQKANTGTHSYRAHIQDNTVSSLTSADPLYIDQSMDLFFSCWYDIQENHDKAFVELSTDARNYEVIDTFTGNSQGWINRTYSLDPYIGSSLFVRFRYATDEQQSNEGFYIDDIFPIATYEQITSLNDSIKSSTYNLSVSPSHHYFYRVRGYNEAYGWGDYSMLTPISEINLNNTVPNPPTITGPQRNKPGQICHYELQAYDPDGHDLYYNINWGDGTNMNWTGPIGSGEKLLVNHSWTNQGTYQIEVRVKDAYGLTSSWTRLPVALSRSKHSYVLFEFLQQLLSSLGIDLLFTPIF